MAFTNTPQMSTYRTTRFDLVGDPTGRNGTTMTQDQRFVNFFPERIKDPSSDGKQFFLRERPGMISVLDTTHTGVGRGMAYFNGHYYTAIGNHLYQDTTQVATLGNSTGHVGFTEYNGTYTSLIVVDGLNGYEVKLDLTVTQITDVDFPSPHCPYPVFLDGYLFLAKAGTDDIYNSDLENALSWTPGNFITAELYPDPLVCLSKNVNYLIALGTSTVEHFYDAGIGAGSPMQRNDSAVAQMGCPAPESVVSSDDAIYFIGQTDNGGRSVWHISGFDSKELAIPVVKQHLDSEGTNISQAVGYVVRTMGHKFYVITTTTRTWAYDVEEQMWHEWTYNDDLTPFICKYSCDIGDGLPKMLHPSNGNILSLSGTVAHDAINSTTNVPIYGVITTNKMDFSSNNRKACYRLSMIGDAPNSAGDVPISVSWSDDDYQTWSTPRTIQLHGNFQALTQLGMFRRRAWKFVYNQDYPLRLEGFELDVNIGIH